MARPNATQTRNILPDQFSLQDSPIVPQVKTFCVPPKGMDTALRLNMMEPALSRLAQNLHIIDGTYKARDGTSQVGDVSGSPVIYAGEFRLSNGDSWLVRWRENGVDYLNSGVFTPVNGSALVAGKSTTGLALTGWNDTLVFGTQIGRLYSLNFSGVPTVVELTQSPLRVIHLTTFNGRIIASLRGTRIQWCVKNDNTKWDPIDPLFPGAGYEDLLSSPGGKTDSQIAVVPITDAIAYAIRSNSIWQMSVTGDFDAPFAFSQLYAGVGCLYPMTVQAIRRGVAFLSQDDVIIVTPDGIRGVGEAVRRTIFQMDRQYLRKACMAWDTRENILRLSVPGPASQSAMTVYNYHINKENPLGPGAWTVDTYQFPIRALTFTRYAQSTLTIDELPGTIDGLTGIIDDLGVSDRSVGSIYAMDGESKRVARDNATQNNSLTRDIDSIGLLIQGGWRIETGYCYAGASLKKTSVVEIQLEYESEADCQVLLEYSVDGGVSWTQYDQTVLPNSNGRPDVASMRLSLYRDQIQFAASTAATPNFRFIAMHVMAAEGARIEDAR